jgi:hypothetical protein
MRVALLAGCLALVGCLGTYTPGTPASDDAGAPPSTGSGNGTGGGVMAAHDLASAGASDMAGGGGLAPFGGACTVDGNCQPGLTCQKVNLGMYCTKSCTMKGLADPACPNTGQCNNNGFCKP